MEGKTDGQKDRQMSRDEIGSHQGREEMCYIISDILN